MKTEMLDMIMPMLPDPVCGEITATTRLIKAALCTAYSYGAMACACKRLDSRTLDEIEAAASPAEPATEIA